jgi:hypothetical protein
MRLFVRSPTKRRPCESIAIVVMDVTALFLTIPYGKFVHGIYRTVALVKDGLEASAGDR